MQRIIAGSAQVEAQMVTRVPTGRMPTPEEIAEVVVLLCCDGDAFVPGRAPSCDGGVVAS